MMVLIFFALFLSHAAALATTQPPFDPRVSPHQYVVPRQKVGVIIVDHGSKRESSNLRLESLCQQFQSRVQHIVKPAHMEIASPTIDDAFQSCVSEGCELIIVHPFFLGPGKHASEDIPRLVDAARQKHPNVKAIVTDPLGADSRILDIIHSSVTDAVRKEEGGSFEDSFFGSIQAAMERAQQQTAPTKKKLQ